jgi:hypothetical protein
MNAAIQATLELADSLAKMATQGAGYYPDWGSRVTQAVEPLRDVHTFRDRTLDHNNMLLEHNGKMIRERDEAIAELNALKKKLLR